MFIWLAQPTTGAASRVGTPAGATSKVTLRLIAPPPAAPTAPLMEPALDAPAIKAAPNAAPEPTLLPLQKAETPSRRVAAVTPSTAVEAQSADTPSTTQGSEPAGSTTTEASSSSIPAIASAPIPAGLEDYVARSLLTLAPNALAPVMVQPPPGDFGATRLVGILSLYIDDEGAVRHVEGNEPLLPALLEQAAREAFMATRFAPGEVDGRPVKTRIQVEVVFDNTPLK